MKKNIISIVLVLVFLFMAVSCEKKTATMSYSSSQPEVVNTAKVETSTSKENTPAQGETKDVGPITEEVVVLKEKVEEPVEVEDPVKEDFSYKYTYTYAGYTIEAEVHNGYGYVTYPAFITDAEIEEAFKLFVKAHGSYGIKYKKASAGKLEIHYAEDLSLEDFSAFAAIVNKDLTWYLDDMFAPAPAVEVPVEEPVVEEPEVVEPVTEEPVVEEPVIEEPVVEEIAVEKVKQPVHVDSNLILSVFPYNVVMNAKNVAYSFGGNLAYEVRFNKTFAVDVAAVYNWYLNKDNRNTYYGDIAAVVDGKVYGQVNDTFSLNLSTGFGINFYYNGKAFVPMLMTRTNLGADFAFNDKVAFEVSTGVQFSSNVDTSILCYQPARIGLRITF